MPPNQVVLGATTLAQLHKKLGETVTFSDGMSKPRTLVIVGTATMASITKGLEMGTGALVATSDFPAALLNAQQSPIPGPNAVVIRIRAGVDPTAASSRLEEVDRQDQRDSRRRRCGGRRGHGAAPGRDRQLPLDGDDPRDPQWRDWHSAPSSRRA